MHMQCFSDKNYWGKIFTVNVSDNMILLYTSFLVFHFLFSTFYHIIAFNLESHRPDLTSYENEMKLSFSQGRYSGEKNTRRGRTEHTRSEMTGLREGGEVTCVQRSVLEPKSLKLARNIQTVLAPMGACHLSLQTQVCNTVEVTSC